MNISRFLELILELTEVFWSLVIFVGVSIWAAIIKLEKQKMVVLEMSHNASYIRESIKASRWIS